MSYDGSFTHAMVHELDRQLTGGRISKINQPYPNEVIVTIRSNRDNYPLLLSANPSYARVQVTDIPYQNPAVPTNFAMTLRKYLSGSVLTKVSQPGNDRVIHLSFTKCNEIGDLESLVLIVEIMARHSNIILIDGRDRQIIDSIKRIGPDKSRYRTIMPGMPYNTPPKQDLIDPFGAEATAPLAELIQQNPNQDVLAHALQKTYQGLGTDTALQLALTLHQPGSATEHFQDFFAQFDTPKPTLLTGAKPDFLAFPPVQDVEQQPFETLDALLDAYYATKAQRDRVREQGGALIKVTKNELKKNRTKVKKLNRTLAETEKADELRVKGEVLTTYLHQVKQGATSVKLPNFYANNQDITIKLAPDKTPAQNAQRYFKRYQKQKNAVQFVNQQLAITNAEISYLESVQSQIELATPSDLGDIKAELQQGGYLRDHDHKKKPKKVRATISKPEAFYSDDGTLILVGKNNLQNDRLTTKTADKRDTWLHTQKIHGSHVIIRDLAPSDETIMQAAMLAAYFSKARESANVPVDYVQVRYVKKPNGAKPGFVTYTGQTTVYVTPTKQMVDHLRNNNHN